jgi:heme exporter protein C
MMSESAMRVLGGAAAVAALVAAVLGLAVAPPDSVQGQPQRLMYVHVPAAWVGYLAFAVVLVASVGYLLRRDLRWDRHARAAAELGTGLTALAIVTGSLWGRPVWGVWWAWEPRLITTVVLLVVYLGYLGIRTRTADPEASARRAAVVGIAAFVNVPIVHFSVVWWRTLHQPPTVLRPGGPADAIAPAMLAALLAGVIAFTVVAVWVHLRRVHALTVAQAAGTAHRDRRDSTAAPVVELTVTARRQR